MNTRTPQSWMWLPSEAKLDMRLMDVVTTYLYKNLDKDIYMKILEGFFLPEAKLNRHRDVYSVKPQWSLYDLKQSGRMWYNRLNEFLLKQGFINNEVCPCIFIRAKETGFVIIAAYVDDLNLITSPEEITNIPISLTKESEMNDLGKTKFVLAYR